MSARTQNCRRQKTDMKPVPQGESTSLGVTLQNYSPRRPFGRHGYLVSGICARLVGPALTEIKFATQLQVVATEFCRNPFSGQRNEILRRMG